MTSAVLASAVLAVLLVPHAVRLEHAPPVLGAAIWLLALALRALLVVFLASTLVAVLAPSGVLHALTHWCWHTVLPLVDTSPGVDGHSVGDVAVTVPILLLAASIASVTVGLWQAARAVRRLVRCGLTGGPRDSLIVQDDTILIAAAGLRHPTVVVSAGALTALDDAELAAGLDHEQGHIRRRHRWLLVAGEVLRALGRLIPGSRHAADELAFHLERDADRYALEHAHAPLDLAHAICKAAAGASPTLTATRLNGGDAARRVRQLVEPPPRRRPALAPKVLAVVMAALTAVLLAALPGAAMAAASAPRGGAEEHCTD